jgi:hypothetical protein
MDALRKSVQGGAKPVPAKAASKRSEPVAKKKTARR